MRRTLRQHVGDGGGEVVADVRTEERQHATAVLARNERVADQAHRVGPLVDRRKTEPAQLVEERSRMNVPRHRLREGLEARRPALALQGPRVAVLVMESPGAHPAREDLRRRRRPHRRPRGDVERDPRHLAPCQSGGGADAADVARARRRLTAARTVDERALQRLFDHRKAQAARQAQLGDRREHLLERVAQRRVGGRG